MKTSFTAIVRSWSAGHSNSQFGKTRRLKSRQQEAKPTFVGWASVGEGRLCLLLVQIYLPPQIKLRIVELVGGWSVVGRDIDRNAPKRILPKISCLAH